MKVIVHNESNLATIDYRKLQPLQGELKVMSEAQEQKLKESFTRLGFSFPFLVWMNPEDKKPYIVDGHGRHKFMMKHNVRPYKMPYSLITAKDKTQAVEKLLMNTSSLQDATKAGLDLLIQENNLDREWVENNTEIAITDIQDLIAENSTSFDPNYNPKTDNTQYKEEDFEDTESHKDSYIETRQHLEVICPHCAETFQINKPS